MEAEWEELYLHHKDSRSYVKELEVDLFPIIKPITNGQLKLAISLPLIDKTYFGLLIGPKIDKNEFSSFDKISVQIFLQLLANAYQSFLNLKKEKELIFSLNHKVLQLNSLIDTGIELSSLEKIDSLHELALERAVVLTNASAGCVIIYEDMKEIKFNSFPPGYDRDYIINSKNKLIAGFEFLNKKYEFLVIEKESRRGIVDFDETDNILLGAFARQLSSAIENEHLHKEALEKENIKKELSVAADIQKKIIPEKLPVIEGYDVAGINIPSKEVGGDYYDCKKLNDGRYALIMADVAGKGVPASLLVSTLNASLNSYLDFQIPLSELAVKINTIVYNSSPTNKFITFFIAILNPGTGELDIINAGHNPALLIKNDGSLYKINAGGVALGMFDMGLPFNGENLVMKQNEKLLLFTDGIPEAMNRDEVEYSDGRLEKFFADYEFTGSINFINALVKDVRKHTKKAPQSDDITALCLIRNN
jgi:sigma-B regulation protein RsbU (phosphoserine phosphatase)